METSESTLKNDTENEDGDVKVKEEKVYENHQSTENEDDDVIVLPQEDPIITEILDESELTDLERTDNNMSVTDDDVMIQEPKIETQVVPDDDDDDVPMSESLLPVLPVKIKEEPKDDGYEDAVNEEDPFEEVTEIVCDDLGGKLQFQKKYLTIIINSIYLLVSYCIF